MGGGARAAMASRRANSLRHSFDSQGAGSQRFGGPRGAEAHRAVLGESGDLPPYPLPPPAEDGHAHGGDGNDGGDYAESAIGMGLGRDGRGGEEGPAAGLPPRRRFPRAGSLDSYGAAAATSAAAEAAADSGEEEHSPSVLPPHPPGGFPAVPPHLAGVGGTGPGSGGGAAPGQGGGAVQGGGTGGSVPLPPPLPPTAPAFPSRLPSLGRGIASRPALRTEPSSGHPTLGFRLGSGTLDQGSGGQGYTLEGSAGGQPGNGHPPLGVSHSLGGIHDPTPLSTGSSAATSPGPSPSHPPHLQPSPPSRDLSASTVIATASAGIAGYDGSPAAPSPAPAAGSGGSTFPSPPSGPQPPLLGRTSQGLSGSASVGYGGTGPGPSAPRGRPGHMLRATSVDASSLPAPVVVAAMVKSPQRGNGGGGVQRAPGFLNVLGVRREQAKVSQGHTEGEGVRNRTEYILR